VPLIERGRIGLTGANAIAGEWGHNPLPLSTAEDSPLPLCYCGRAGCIETYLSGPGLARDHEARTGARLSPEEIVSLGDQSLERYVERLARALASVINVLDPMHRLGGECRRSAPVHRGAGALRRYVFDHVAT
jgi:fructokinase